MLRYITHCMCTDIHTHVCTAPKMHTYANTRIHTCIRLSNAVNMQGSATSHKATLHNPGLQLTTPNHTGPIYIYIYITHKSMYICLRRERNTNTHVHVHMQSFTHSSPNPLSIPRSTSRQHRAGLTYSDRNGAEHALERSEHASERPEHKSKHGKR